MIVIAIMINYYTDNDNNIRDENKNKIIKYRCEYQKQLPTRQNTLFYNFENKQLTRFSSKI